MTDTLPIDQEFTTAVMNGANLSLPHPPLTPAQVEAVLLTLHRLGEFTPPAWRPWPGQGEKEGKEG